MNKLEEFEKKIQQLKKKYQKATETVSLLKKENTMLKKDIQEKNILLSKSPTGIVLIWRGRILEVNETFVGYMGYKAEEMINRNFLNFVHPDHLSEVRFIHNKWSAGKVSKGQYDTRLVTENDDEILCSIESRRIRYRGRASYILNITRLEDREEKQKRKRQEIRNSTELKMIEGLKSRLKKRSDAIPDLSKVPANANELYGRSIYQAIDKLKAEQEDILLEISMLEAITSEKEEYQEKNAREINLIIDEAIDNIGRSIDPEAINIKTYLRASSSINGSPGALTDALTQLLLNSISNISGSGEIHITTEENAEKIYIYIQDNCMGIGEYQIDTAIFESFTDYNSSLTHELGMRFVKAVIERHNGKIEYLPGSGQGNVFQITLPVFHEVRKRRKIDRNKLKKARILIIQADDIARELLAHLLTEKGCRVEKTGSSIEGLAAIKKKKINMLIMDTEILRKNIKAFWKKCRKINPDLITVGLCNGTGTGENGQPDETGPDLVISKPFDIKDAVNRISELFMVEY